MFHRRGIDSPVIDFLICQIYHQWMSSPELLRLTASEPLTLEEEYDMQGFQITSPFFRAILTLRPLGRIIGSFREMACGRRQCVPFLRASII